MTRRWCAAGLLLGCFVGIGGVAQASDASELSDAELAAMLFRKGNDAFAAGQLVDAAGAYTKAWQLSRSYDIACNLGRTEVELGRSRDAAEHLSFCVRHFAASSRSDVREAREKFVGLFNRVRESIAELVLSVEPVGVQFTLDGVLLGPLPLQEPLFVAAGPHHLDFSLPGMRPAKRDIVAGRGATERVIVSLTAASSSAPGALPMASAAGSPASVPLEGDVQLVAAPPAALSTRTWVLMSGSALTLVGLGVGAGFSLDARSASKRADVLRAQVQGSTGSDSGCSGVESATCHELQQASDRNHSSSTIATIGWLVGGASAVGTGLTFLLWQPKSQSSAQRRRVTLTPQLSPTHPGLLLSGHF